MLGWLSDVERHGDRLRAVWHGRPPPFEPGEQVHPFVVESDDGLERSEGWLCRTWSTEGGEPGVEIGSERDAPPWRRSADEKPEYPRATVHSARVLVVDDDPDTLDVVTEALATEGWDVVRASSGREALDLAQRSPPDLAVVDLIMPEVTGADVCAAFRRDPRLSSARLLVLSAAEDTRVVAAECDADGAVTKPFTLALLVREVRRLLGS